MEKSTLYSNLVDLQDAIREMINAIVREDAAESTTLFRKAKTLMTQIEEHIQSMGERKYEDDSSEKETH